MKTVISRVCRVLMPTVGSLGIMEISLRPHRALGRMELAGAPKPDDPAMAGESDARRFLGTAQAWNAAGKDSIVIFDEYGGAWMTRATSHLYVRRYGDAPA